jgi:CheY-specific phosphatase CheX
MQLSDLAAFILPSCEDVLDAMYFTSVMEITDIPPEALDSTGYSFSLHFKGDLCGHFGVSCHREAARTLAANFLGEEEDAIADTETAEVIGELANMLCGSILSRTGCTNIFALSHPMPTPKSLPSHPGAEALYATLNTDIGTIHTWILFDQPGSADTSRGNL